MRHLLFWGKHRVNITKTALLSCNALSFQPSAIVETLGIGELEANGFL